jgi:hypothetical protein
MKIGSNRLTALTDRKTILYLLLLLGVVFNASAQLGNPDHPRKAKNYAVMYNGPDFVLLEGREDTIFCDRVKMNMYSNDPVKLEFQVNGKDTVISGFDCKKAIAFQTDGVLMQYLPANPEKPWKHHQHLFRSTDGYITIWSNEHKFYERFVTQQPNNRQYRGHTVTYILASISGGPLFIPSQRNYKKYILPLFEECEEMDKSGWGYYMARLIKMADSYNQTCGKNLSE